MVEKNGLIRENKTAIKNATDILSSAATKSSKSVSTNYMVCMVTIRIAAFHLCQEWVAELLGVIRNKLPFYQQGLRGLNLIQQSL